MKRKQNAFAKAGTAIGVGLMAGLAGTAAMTAAQMIDKKITGQKSSSSSPVQAVGKVLDVQPTTGEKKSKVTNEVHWTYGTSLGMVRSALRLIGLKGWAATTSHFVAIWAAENIMLPSLKISPPINELPAKEVAKDGFFHAVYAVAAGLVYDAIDRD